MAEQERGLRELVAEVAAAYFSNAHVGQADIPGVINQIASSLRAVEDGSGQIEGSAAEQPTRATPAQVRRSITPDALISFEDGRPYETLKRHLSTRGMTLDQYKAKWGLPGDYPSVAPNYSAARSEMARQIGLGSKGRGRRAGRRKAGS